MKRVQRGFTLIELVMVIVILGVLAAVAMPRFVDLRGDAQQAALEATAGSAASASVINYAGCSLVNNSPTAAGVTPVRCTTVNSCAGVAGLLSGGVLPNGYTTTGGTMTNGSTATCPLTLDGYTSTNTVTFEVIGAGN